MRNLIARDMRNRFKVIPHRNERRTSEQHHVTQELQEGIEERRTEEPKAEPADDTSGLEC